MVPYYVMPGIGPRSGGRSPTQRSGGHGVCMAGAGLTVMTFTHHGRWEYWLELTGLTVAVLALAWPAQTVRQGVRAWPEAP